MKIIIDTNIWMSFIIGKTILKLKDIIEQNSFEIIITNEIINEINRASQYPRFIKYFQKQEVEEFFKYFNSISSNIELKSKVDICRDEKDNYLLALAQDTEADFIVTGDKDLLILKKFGKTEIIRFAKFTELF